MNMNEKVLMKGAQLCTAWGGVDAYMQHGVTHELVIPDEKGASALARAARPARGLK